MDFSEHGALVAAREAEESCGATMTLVKGLVALVTVTNGPGDVGGGLQFERASRGENQIWAAAGESQNRK